MLHDAERKYIRAETKKAALINELNHLEMLSVKLKGLLKEQITSIEGDIKEAKESLNNPDVVRDKNIISFVTSQRNYLIEHLKDSYSTALKVEYDKLPSEEIRFYYGYYLGFRYFAVEIGFLSEPEISEMENMIKANMVIE